DGGREAVIKLDPDHLGSVSIRLKMTGGRVDVAITVSDTHTLDVLDRDRHLLTAAVSGSGAGTGGLTLSHGATSPAAASGQSFPGGDAEARDRQTSGRDAPASGDPSGGRRRDGRHGAGAPSGEGGLDDAAPAPAPARAGAFYV
ncbi:MAG: flagellar hook-length control protein FliK, partial [Janthinobacterium lividum]